MSHIVKSFREFEQIFESVSATNKFETDFPDKWKQMQDLGFYDVTTPIMRKNGSVLLKNDKYNDYPGGIVFQNSGYIRNKLVKSGFVKKDLSWEEMADYIIKRYTSYKDPSPKGYENFPPHIVTLIRKVTKSKVSINPQTGRLDVSGVVNIENWETWENLREVGIQFGSVKEFTLRGYVPFSYTGSKVMTREDQDMLPTEVNGSFTLSYLVFGIGPDFSKLPEFKELTYIYNIQGPGLRSLKGMKLKNGASLWIKDCSMLETVENNYPDYLESFIIGEGNTGNQALAKISSIASSPRTVDEFGFCGTSIKNLKGCPEKIYKSIDVRNNPFLNSLEGMPEDFNGIIKTDYFECRFSIEDRIEMLVSESVYERRRGEKVPLSKDGMNLVISSFRGDDEDIISIIQNMIDKNPEKMAVKLKEYTKDHPIKKKLKWPENLKQEVDLLSNLNRVGL
jgi:hypothetical protein